MAAFSPGKRKAGMITLIVAWILAIGWCISRSEARSSIADSGDRDQRLLASLDHEAVGARQLCAGAACAESRAAIPETIGIQIVTVLTAALLFSNPTRN